jgi:peptidoglycan/LPS O-acetylase OafA/YrhL
MPESPAQDSQPSELPRAINASNHIDSLDGWRGIAILLVFVFHYVPRELKNPLEFIASLGWSGVDLFFVLSGFLITGILYDSRESEGYFKAFYMRRILRLFPVYFLAVAVVLMGTHLLSGTRSWVYIPFFFYGANIVLAFPSAQINFLPHFSCSHFWSLALEEQFYSIWPFVVFYVPRRRTLMMVCIAGIVAALSIRVSLLAIHARPWLAFAELPARMDSLLAGALLSLGIRGQQRERWLRPRTLRWCISLAMGTLVIAILISRSVSFISPSISTFGFSAIAIAGACIVALALVPNTFTSRLGKTRVLRFYGRYSYGLYIWHFLPSPMLASWTMPGLEHVPVILAELIRLVVLLTAFTALSVMSYHLFEVHFLRLKARFAYRKRVTADGQYSIAK